LWQLIFFNNDQNVFGQKNKIQLLDQWWRLNHGPSNGLKSLEGD
jgi:hypothetical protein